MNLVISWYYKGSRGKLTCAFLISQTFTWSIAKERNLLRMLSLNLQVFANSIDRSLVPRLDPRSSYSASASARGDITWFGVLITWTCSTAAGLPSNSVRLRLTNRIAFPACCIDGSLQHIPLTAHYNQKKRKGGTIVPKEVFFDWALVLEVCVSFVEHLSFIRNGESPLVY